MIVNVISTVLSMQAWARILQPERGVSCRSHEMIIEWLLLLYDSVECKTIHSSSAKRGSRAASSTAYHSRWKAVQKQAAQGATAMQPDACSACMGAGYHAATCSDQQGSHRMGTQQLSPVPVRPVTSQDGTHIRRWRCGNATSY